MDLWYKPLNEHEVKSDSLILTISLTTKSARLNIRRMPRRCLITPDYVQLITVTAGNCGVSLHRLQQLNNESATDD